MKKTLTQLGCTALFFSTLSITGCGGSSEPAIVGGPTPEIQAQLDARESGYSQSMSESRKGDRSQ